MNLKGLCVAGVLLTASAVFLIPSGTGGCGGGTEEGTTPPGDTTGPTVDPSTISPADGVTDASRFVAITIPFGEPMDTASVEAAFNLAESEEGGSLSVKGQAAGSVSGTFAWNDVSSEVTFTPSALDPITRYCMGVSAVATDASGNAITPFESCFTTLCASSAEFDDESDLSCLILYKIPLPYGSPLVEEAIPGSFFDSLTVAGGTLTLDFNTVNSGLDEGQGEGLPELVKSIASGDFEVEFHIGGGAPVQEREQVGFGVGDPNFQGSINVMWRAGAIQYFAITDGAMGDDLTENIETSCVTFRINRSGNTYTTSYKPCGGDFTVWNQETRSAVNDPLASSTASLGVGFYGASGSTLGTFAPVIDYLRFNSGSAEGQE